mmetsp:Transcript_44184/g.86703  ORF Transcript_44184/g.86703 Transcript_44184/m.86703 type:complete len:326 (+) Transcript_44184:149-1126(+)|eukprot:CAMPEP_0194329400 /NCGR_PEP_ID=MMETSP0171-20130528/48171_1 /TAXON_ID=218684 /ORGANISM="Corethron pennatum, Strain L29A3" /LENGTH=325 /DNA_ID=CAMNT_0039090131 /DNA_START=68 /DNA_END=1045 /DNA_ORIENTATION=-
MTIPTPGAGSKKRSLSSPATIEDHEMNEDLNGQNEPAILFDSLSQPACAGVFYSLQPPGGDSATESGPYRCVVTGDGIRLLAIDGNGEEEAACVVDVDALLLHAVVHPPSDDDDSVEVDREDDDVGMACIYCQLDYMPEVRGGEVVENVTRNATAMEVIGGGADIAEEEDQENEEGGVIWTRPEEEDGDDDCSVPSPPPWEMRLYVKNIDGEEGSGVVRTILQEMFDAISHTVMMNPSNDDDGVGEFGGGPGGIGGAGWVCAEDFLSTVDGEEYDPTLPTEEERQAMLARLDAVTTVSPEVEAIHAANMGADSTKEGDGQFDDPI